MPPDDSPAIYDEYTGIGGTYVRDPVTGVRQPAPPETTAAAPGAEEQPE